MSIILTINLMNRHW